jgi:hypothetical protein
VKILKDFSATAAESRKISSHHRRYRKKLFEISAAATAI